MITTDAAFRNLLDFRTVCSSLDIPFFLDGGTLLGAYRDGDFCEDDQDDIDLTTWDIQWEKSRELEIALQDIGFRIHKRWDRETFKLKGKETTSQHSFVRDSGKVDLMFKRTGGEWAWWTVYCGMRPVYKQVPSEYVKATKDFLFRGETFQIPADTEKYLTYRYGDWQTKVHRSKYRYDRSDKSIVKKLELT